MTLHLIYGIACAGKSTTALRLAADNGVRTIISTDYLREVQRLYVPAAQSPVLAKVSHTAWELSGDPTPGGIIAGFTSHAEAVFPAVEAVAAKLTRDGLDAVIEGSPFHEGLPWPAVSCRPPPRRRAPHRAACRPACSPPR